MPFARARLASRWLIFLAIGWLSACTAQHRTIDVAELSLSEVPPLSCPVVLTDLRDEVGTRGLPASSGSVVKVAGLPDRIESRVRAWEQTSLSDGPRLELRLDLVRAYSELKGDRTYFHTVLVATTPDGEQSILRGRHRQLNWWGTEAEFARAVERSLDQALLRLHSWLDTRCRTSRTAADARA